MNTYIYRGKGAWKTGDDIPFSPDVSISWRGEWGWVAPIVFKVKAEDILEADKACREAGFNPQKLGCIWEESC